MQAASTARIAKTERQRRWRERRRHGRALFRVEADQGELLEALIASGRVSEAEALRPRLVTAVLSEILAEWSRRWRV